MGDEEECKCLCVGSLGSWLGQERLFCGAQWKAWEGGEAVQGRLGGAEHQT